MKGRKRKQESRSAEIRQKLLNWKQMPEFLRPSLRALATKLGTSHQLLAHYLDGLEIWAAREHQRCVEAEYNRKVDEIRRRAKAEYRPLTSSELGEMERVSSGGEERFPSQVDLALLEHLWRLKRRADRRLLDRDEIELLKVIVRNGFPGAQTLLVRKSPGEGAEFGKNKRQWGR